MQAGGDDDRLLHQRPAPLESRPYKLRPPSDRTHPFAWLAAILCAALWAVIILGGLAVLIVYLVFRPRSPRVDISGATLNAAYLDSDPLTGAANLLNADLTVLANFSNPNTKVAVSFGDVAVELYFRGALIAVQGVDAFAEGVGEAQLRSVHLLSSEVLLTPEKAEAWRRAMAGGGVGLVVVGKLRTRLHLGSLLRFSYGLYTHCSIMMSAPPSGVLVSRKCRTRR